MATASSSPFGDSPLCELPNCRRSACCCPTVAALRRSTKSWLSRAMWAWLPEKDWLGLLCSDILRLHSEASYSFKRVHNALHRQCKPSLRTVGVLVVCRDLRRTLRIDSLAAYLGRTHSRKQSSKWCPNSCNPNNPNACSFCLSWMRLPRAWC